MDPTEIQGLAILVQLLRALGLAMWSCFTQCGKVVASGLFEHHADSRTPGKALEAAEAFGHALSMYLLSN